MDSSIVNKPPTKPHIVKWIVIGALGTMAIFVLFIGILIYTFTPLIKIDEGTGRVSLFGGTVDVQARDVITQLSKDGSFVFGAMDGLEKLSPEIKTIEVKFGTGEIRLDYNDGDDLNWDCDGAGKSSKFQKQAEQGRVVLDFSAAFVDCDISLPKRSIKISGNKGQVEVRKMQSPLEISLSSGDVYLQPMDGLAYQYTLNDGEDAESDSFTSSVDKNAIPIKVEIKVGSVLTLD